MPPVKNELKINMEDTNSIIKHMLKTLMDRCKAEAEYDAAAIPFGNIQARIKYYTGLPNAVIEKLLCNTPVATQLTLASQILILETIKGLYVQHRLPTYNTIFEETCGKLMNNQNQPIVNMDELIKEMNILGYVLKETVTGTVIVMEDPEVRFERFMYLYKLKKLRNNSVQWQQIVYVDKRLINLNQDFVKPALTGVTGQISQNIKESVFFHAVCKAGFISGMFSNQDNFDKWVMDILLVHLKIPSVIIMDTLSGPPENVSSITRYHSKTEMLCWLTNNNIPCSSNMSKPALFELIAKCNEKQKEYHIDRVIRSQGHEVLRLPRHLFDLSITTPLWKALEKKGKMDDVNSLIDVQNQLMRHMTALPAATWAEYEQEIEKTEREIFGIDTTMENFCDMYEIKI